MSESPSALLPRAIRLPAVLGLLAASAWVAGLEAEATVRALWPAIVALVAIFLLRHAAGGLACGVAAGALVAAGGQPVEALRAALADHAFPAMQGPWKLGALVFTLLLGAFAGVLERSGGFESLLRRLLRDGRDGGRRLLGGVYGIGLLCFFDGLANSLLSGRIARPLADRAGVSREKLAWVVDSTSSPVACVAFISTWIATQLSLIEQGLADAPFAVDPYGMFFRSIPANAYCLLTLLLVPLALATRFEPGWMRRYRPVEVEAETDRETASSAPARVVLLPLAALVAGILASFALLAGEPVNPLTADGWRRAFSGAGGPYALVLGSLIGLGAAFAMYPRERREEASAAAVRGAGALLPALVVLILAWTLGSLFRELGAAAKIATLLGEGVALSWMPLAVFLTSAAVAFATGSSWGTMGLLMPLALPALLAAGAGAGSVPGELFALAPAVIGAVFGGAVFGDHCSPFSDTTIVSALACGCRPLDHVISQLPYALLACLAAVLAYAAMALGLHPAAATGLAALAMAGWVLARGRRRSAAG